MHFIDVSSDRHCDGRSCNIYNKTINRCIETVRISTTSISLLYIREKKCTLRSQRNISERSLFPVFTASRNELSLKLYRFLRTYQTSRRWMIFPPSRRAVLYRSECVSGTGNGMHPAPTTPPTVMYRMPPPTAGGINEPQECPYCRRTFSCYYSLKRHFQDKHEQSDTLYVCEFCNRTYRTKNSLTTHKSLQHRGTSGVLRRLLKATAMKNVFGTMQHQMQMQQQPQ